VFIIKNPCCKLPECLCTLISWLLGLRFGSCVKQCLLGLAVEDELEPLGELERLGEAENHLFIVFLSLCSSVVVSILSFLSLELYKGL